MGPIRLWEDPKKGHPVEEAERAVQQMIRHPLVGRFLCCSQIAANDAINEGVNQANAFGAANNSLIRMLCCFDMRSDDPGDDATLVQVKDRAVTFLIRLKRWYLYRSSQDWRDANAQRQLVAASGATIAK